MCQMVCFIIVYCKSGKMSNFNDSDSDAVDGGGHRGDDDDDDDDDDDVDDGG